MRYTIKATLTHDLTITVEADSAEDARDLADAAGTDGYISLDNVSGDEEGVWIEDGEGSFEITEVEQEQE